jgi:hypothetical protein
MCRSVPVHIGSEKGEGQLVQYMALLARYCRAVCLSVVAVVWWGTVIRRAGLGVGCVG